MADHHKSSQSQSVAVCDIRGASCIFDPVFGERKLLFARANHPSLNPIIILVIIIHLPAIGEL